MELILSFSALGISVILFIIMFVMYRKTRRIVSVDSKETLVKQLDDYFTSIEDVQEAHRALLGEMKKLGTMSHRSMQKSGFHRYNPFEDTGGNQSFSICLLDAHNNGFIISSLHGREGTRMYAKEIKNSQPIQTLSDEENLVLHNALKKEGNEIGNDI